MMGGEVGTVMDSESKTDTSIRVALYGRVSTQDKGQDPETQLQPLREFARVQGWDVVGEFVDQASATNSRGRKAWKAVLLAAAQRKIDLVLIWKLDRAFRSLQDAVSTLTQLRAWKVGLRSYTEPIIDTANGSAVADLMFNILASFAAFERSLIAERVQAGMARARKQGKALGRPRVLNGDFEALRPAIQAGTLSMRAAARKLGVSLPTVLRELRRRAS
jgi:DNA invertase Pin-like site-specific DNA recombinase